MIVGYDGFERLALVFLPRPRCPPPHPTPPPLPRRRHEGPRPFGGALRASMVLPDYFSIIKLITRSWPPHTIPAAVPPTPRLAAPVSLRMGVTS